MAIDTPPSASKPPSTSTTSDASVIIAAPMLNYRCNQKGCCCQQWMIPFKPEGFARLAAALPDEEAQRRLHWGLELTVDEETQQITRVELAKHPQSDACRFLEEGGGCEIHRRFGTSALPDLCVNFPAVPFDNGESVELHYEAMCPSVLDQLAHDTTPYEVTTVSAHDHPEIALRARRPVRSPQVKLGPELTLSWREVNALRAATLNALKDVERPAIEHLAAISYAFDRLRVHGDVARFELRYDEAQEPFYDFLDTCARVHSSPVIAAWWRQYKRFVWDFDRDSPGLQHLEHHLSHWEAALGRWMVAQEPTLRALLVRFLAHRYFSVFISVRGELVFAYGSIPHAYAFALRVAAGLSGALARPTDLAIMKAALGMSDYVYRGLQLPVSALPWFTPFSDPPGDPD